jgi:Tol biopolymer transport system component
MSAKSHASALLSALALLLTPSAFAAAPRVPEVFLPGLVSLPGQEEYRIIFTPDGRTAFWGVGEELFPSSRQATIVYSEWRHGRWSEPRPAPFSGVYSDIDPFISPDGRRLFFSSIRPVNGVPREDVELWVVERRGHGWSEPRHLGAAVNSTSDELYPSVDAWGTLYFGSDRPGGYGIWDIWRAYPRADGTYGPAENLGPAINTDTLDFNPTITPDGQTLLFASIGREDGYGYGDLYVAERVRGRWQPARNLGPVVNTSQDEYHPSLSPDGRTLYFVRHEYEPEYLPADLFHVRTQSVLPHCGLAAAGADSEE